MTSVGAPYYAIADQLVIVYALAVTTIITIYFLWSWIRRHHRAALRRKLKSLAKAADNAAISLEHFAEVSKMFESVRGAKS